MKFSGRTVDLLMGHIIYLILRSLLGLSLVIDQKQKWVLRVVLRSVSIIMLGQHRTGFRRHTRKDQHHRWWESRCPVHCGWKNLFLWQNNLIRV